MGDLQVVAAIKKLNNKNYNTWATCMESYLQGQDLWDVVGGNEVTQPEEDTSGTLRKWKIKASKAMFTLKTTVEDDMLEHIRKAKTPKEAWDTFATLFSKRNDTRLQLLENELLSVAQRDITLAEYSTRPFYRGFVAALQGWPTQPSFVEFENLLADQEALAKQMGGVSSRGEEEVLYIKSKGSFKQHADGGSKKMATRKKVIKEEGVLG
ncbi:unnamed protein product [Malus baccata var. baccata]